MINGPKMNAVALHIQRIPDGQSLLRWQQNLFRDTGSTLHHTDACNSAMVMSRGGLLHRLRDFIVANVRCFSGPLQRGPGRVRCVQEMSMTISIRRGKGRSLDAYSTAQWLKSINNKTTQWGARALVHCRSIANQLFFSCVRGEIFILHTLLSSN